MSEKRRLLLRAGLAWSARFMSPAVAVGAVLVVGAAIKGWPALPLLTSSRPQHDPADWCREHGVPEAYCTVCHPELAAGEADEPAELCKLDLPMVRLASVETVRDAGIEVVRVQRRSLAHTIACNGLAAYNQNKLAEVRPRVEGILREVRVDVGGRVQAGDVLAVIDSVELGEAKAAHQSARAALELAEKNFGRLKGLVEEEIVPGKALLEAETRLSEARIRAEETRGRLLNLGLAGAEIDRLAAAHDMTSLLTLAAPLGGVVVHRHAVIGEAVQSTSELFTVADLRSMWVDLSLMESDLPWVREGQPVQFFVRSLPQSGFEGQVTWISTEVDPQTRTIQVRAEVQNSGGTLRAGMFGQGVIETVGPSETQVVPKTAVQWQKGAPVLFVCRGPGLFEPRRVTLGRAEGPFWEVTAGVEPDDAVATTGSFLLKTELMKGAIGAGCCGD